ncbi:MAG: hypothetical protein SFX18_07690 [Pirellulales bacterium]|nr:hypothetical protein [Pirellulales bacterium]
MPPINPYESPRMLQLSAERPPLSADGDLLDFRLRQSSTVCLAALMILGCSLVLYPLFPVGWAVNCVLICKGLREWNAAHDGLWRNSLNWLVIVTRLASLGLLLMVFLAVFRAIVIEGVEFNDYASLYYRSIVWAILGCGCLALSIVVEFCFWLREAIRLTPRTTQRLSYFACVCGFFYALFFIGAMFTAENAAIFVVYAGLAILLALTILTFFCGIGSIVLLVAIRNELARRLAAEVEPLTELR